MTKWSDDQMIRYRPWFFASLFYVLLTVVQTWPLVTETARVLPHDLGDPVLNTWIIWWNAHAVPFTARWWNAPAFWPSSGAFGFSETLLGLTPITSSIQWAGGSPVTAYNVAFLLTFPLSALAAHALAHRLTNRHDAALVAGLVYGFSPFRIAHFPQIQVLTSYWMPLALVGLHGYVTERRRRWLWLFAAAWLMQALSNGYYLLFFPVLVALWLFWFVGTWEQVRTLGGVLIAWGVACVPLVPLLLGYERVHAAYGLTRAGAEAGFGADLTSLFDASPLLKFWTLQRFHQPEGELFPGFVALGLALLLVVGWLMRKGRPARTPTSCLVLLSLSLLFIVVAVSPLIAGPWAITIGRVTLLSVGVPHKPLTIGLLLLVFALVQEPRFSSAWRRRSPVLFYALATGFMYLLSLGPQPRFLGAPFIYKAPYAWLNLLPGYDAIRVPARFAMLAVLCLSVTAAFSFARLSAGTGRFLRLAIASLVAAGILVDSWIGTMPLRALPERLQTLESSPAGVSVMEVPLGDTFEDVIAMYRGMYHRRPVVNGYSGFFPPSYDVLHRGMDLRDPSVFDAVTAWGPVIVALDKGRDADGRWAKVLTDRPGTLRRGEESGHAFFLLPSGAPAVDPAMSGRLPIRSAVASINGERFHLALDGKPDTEWESGPQRGVEVVTVDLGGRRVVDGLSMTIGSRLADFPRQIAIETSDDGREWETRWEGSGTPAAVAGAVRQPLDLPVTFALPHIPARLVRLRQLGQDPVSSWSISELSVFGR